jgi:FkbM family methyltransferase
MPSPGRFAGVLVDRRVPLRTRFDLLRAEARRRLKPKDSYAVRYGPGTVYLSHEHYAIDWESLKFVVVDHAYPTRYDGAVVLDLGAHKGYYAAYATREGARTVMAFEPEQANVRLLRRAAVTYAENGSRWDIREAAVGAAAGAAELHVMDASWSHALHPPDEWMQYQVGVQRVAVEAMDEVLAEAAALAAGGPLVVKLNVEGEECGIVLGTPVEAWSVVTDLFVEYHPWASCTADELRERLATAGFREAKSDVEAVLRFVPSGFS